MRKHLHHPVRTIGAVLTLAGALAAVALLVIPLAVGAGGKDQVSFYTNAKGNVVQKIGEDEYFEVNGKNLDKTVEVFCWAGKEANDATGFNGWDTLTDWATVRPRRCWSTATSIRTAMATTGSA